MDVPPTLEFEPVYLSSLARLEHPRHTTQGHARCIAFDALLPCQNNPEISAIVCNACYELSYCRERIDEGVYYIIIQIAAYEPNIHPPSPVRGDADFTLLGEILELRRLDLPLDFDLTRTPIPSIILAAGTVTSVNRAEDIFTTSHMQEIGPNMVSAVLSLNTVIFANPHWPEPGDQMPMLYQRKVFGGELLSVEGNELLILLDHMFTT